MASYVDRGDELPPASTGTAQERWTARKKGKVCAAIIARAISKEEAISRYGLSDDEIEDWLYAFRKGGAGALKRYAGGPTRPREFIRPAALPEPVSVSPAGRFLRFLKRGW